VGNYFRAVVYRAWKGLAFGISFPW